MEGADLKSMLARTLPALAGVALSFIFGLSFLFSKEALESLEPLELLAHRFSIALLLLLLLKVLGLINFQFRPGMLRELLPLALFQPIIYFLGETYGVKLTTATESGLVIALVPVAVTFLGNYFFKEKVTWQRWVFVWLSLIGVGSIVIAQSGMAFTAHSVGIIYLLVAVIAAALYNVGSRSLSKRYSPIEITMIMMGMGAVFFNILYLNSLPQKAEYFAAFLNLKTLFPLLYLGGLSSVIAFLLLNYMLGKMPASQAASFVNLTTVVSVLAGVVFRGERFGTIQILGGLLILFGVWGSNRYQFRDQ